MTRRIEAFDMMRGLAVIMMAFNHVLLWGFIANLIPVYSVITSAMAPLRMPVLFLISGIMVANLHQREGSPIIRRIVDLGWIYTIWLPISCLYSASFSIATGRSDYDFANLSAEFFDPTTILWFVWVLMLCTATIPIVIRLPRAVTMGVSMTASMYAFNKTPGLFGWDHLMQFSCFFYAGMIFRTDVVEAMRKPLSARRLACVMIAAGLVHLASEYSRRHFGLVLSTVDCFLICAAGLCGMKALQRIPVAVRSMTYLGRNTLPILVLHVPVLVLMREFVPDLGGVNAIVRPLLLTTIVVSGSLIIHQLALEMGADWLFRRPQWINKGNARIVAHRLDMMLASVRGR